MCPVGHLRKNGGAVVNLLLHGLLHIIRGTLDLALELMVPQRFFISRELNKVDSFARGFDRSRKKKLSLPEV